MASSVKTSGVKIIEKFIKTLTSSPGIYKMLDKNGKALYVGKAKNLKKRVISYTKPDKQSLRIQRMISFTCSMDCTTTHTEAEALLLEARLIKKLKPRYNILLRDDKSFPYILLTKNHDFPMLIKHRGAKKQQGDYFGPFASITAVNGTLAILQKIFMLRNCSDNIFKNRRRPCMQYQIKRCTAPCVKKISKKEYSQQAKNAKEFLSGKNRNIQKKFAIDMQKFSDTQNFEKAAIYRDMIRSLTKIQSEQKTRFNGDIHTIYKYNDISCVQVFFFHHGQNFGNRSYFPFHEKSETTEDILSAFITQFYADRPVPKTILVNKKISDKSVISKALKTKIIVPQKGKNKTLIKMALKNAKESLLRKLAANSSQEEIFKKIAKIFKLKKTPERIEVYDNSHISGKHALGAMIVATKEGFQKSSYRKFNMPDNLKGDDIAMMKIMLTRRFKNLIKDTNSPKPDLLLIDGGQTQLNAVIRVMKDIGLKIPIVSIAKGADRNAGRERFFLPNQKPISFKQDDSVLYFLERIRDESHRFVITSHRGKRSRDITKNPLDEIAGIGAKRKKALLLHFGSAKAVADTGINDLEMVKGINRNTAENIYNFFHGN